MQSYDIDLRCIREGRIGLIKVPDLTARNWYENYNLSGMFAPFFIMDCERKVEEQQAYYVVTADFLPRASSPYPTYALELLSDHVVRLKASETGETVARWVLLGWSPPKVEVEYLEVA